MSREGKGRDVSWPANSIIFLSEQKTVTEQRIVLWKMFFSSGTGSQNWSTNSLTPSALHDVMMWNTNNKKSWNRDMQPFIPRHYIMLNKYIQTNNNWHALHTYLCTCIYMELLTALPQHHIPLWNSHWTSLSFCITHPVHPGPWAKTVPRTVLPFPEAGKTQTTFPNMQGPYLPLQHVGSCIGHDHHDW